MHASPSEFRAVRRDGIVLRFAVLDDVAYVRADFPATGSRGTFAEDPCSEPHWGLVIAGHLEVVTDRHTVEVPAGTAFYVPAGVSHRLEVSGGARVAGFTRVAPDAPASEEQLREAGFEIVRTPAGGRESAVAVVRPRAEPVPEPGEVRTDTRRMGELLWSRSLMGRRVGYTSDVCDVPHWGLVLSGSLAIEWEDDVEVLTAGDVFYCPPGPPGHRLQAAEPAVIVDLTPIEAIGGTERIVEWRRGPFRDALADSAGAARVELAALI